LPAYLPTCRWFGGKARPIRAVKNVDVVPFSLEALEAYVTTWEVQYLGGSLETYFLPLGFATGGHAAQIRQANPQAVIARLKVKADNRQNEGILYDCLYDAKFSAALLDSFSRGRRFKGAAAEVHVAPSASFRTVRGANEAGLEPSILKRDQSNTSILYGDRLILKMFRRVTDGVNPELEIGRFLTEKTSFAYSPPLAGFLELRKGRSEPATLGILQGWVANECDAWRYTLDSLDHYFEKILTAPRDTQSPVFPEERPLQLVDQEIPPVARDFIGAYLSSIALLGRRTGEMHTALASGEKDPSFAPEPFTALYRRSLYQSMRAHTEQSFGLLQKRLRALPDETRLRAEKLLKLKSEILNRFRRVMERKITGLRIRCHGDYHLGQVLFTGKDFYIIDFEGEPARPISERRLKRSTLRDVAGMLRSLDYAVTSKLRASGLRAEEATLLKPWARFWNLWVSVAFFQGYFEATQRAVFLPASREELGLLLDALLLEKSVYELGYELNNRPDWVGVPIEGILELLNAADEARSFSIARDAAEGAGGNLPARN
jgi:maltose alpha-D-glucosyltransferase/alpha-amylase